MTISQFWVLVRDIMRAVTRTYLPAVGTMIRESPILLFSFGFVALGATCIVLGRLLSRD